MSYENPWLHNGNIIDSEILDNYLGFVYLITNLTNNRKYIGKKLLKFSRTKMLKGKKKRTSIESDWRDYYSSSNELVEDVNEIGNHNFKREILKLCKTKNECNYWEAKFQFENDVLLKPDEWYNGWIMVRVRRSKSLV